MATTIRADLYDGWTSAPRAAAQEGWQGAQLEGLQGLSKTRLHDIADGQLPPNSSVQERLHVMQTSPVVVFVDPDKAEFRVQTKAGKKISFTLTKHECQAAVIAARHGGDD